MKNKAFHYIYEIAALLTVIFFGLWFIFYVIPLQQFAEVLSGMGVVYGGPVSDILGYLFLNIYFIITILTSITAAISKIGDKISNRNI